MSDALRKAAAAMGRKGGKAKSDRKTASSRENGKKGGWPKGKPRKPPILGALLIVAALAGCSIPGVTHPERFTSTQQVMEWTAANIVYKPAIDNYWQTPVETYSLRTGNCVGFTLLAMYFMHDAGIDSAMVLVPYSSTNTDAVVLDKQTGIMWIPQTGYRYTGATVQEISYADAQWRAAYLHK